MKQNFSVALLFFITLSLISKAQSTTDKEIDAWISKMTLEEKVGQMTNLTITTIASEKDNSIIMDSVKLRDVLVRHHVGSIQNTIYHGYTLQEWHMIVNTIQKVNMTENRLKIPVLYCIDAVHGANYTLGSTLFPHNIGLAATRNPALVQKCGEITAKEVRASGIRYNFSPVLDAGRQPLWSRFGETFGEDIYLVKTMGVACIRGYEGKSLKDVTSVAACMKHYVGYSNPQIGRDRAPAYIPEIMLREYYLPSFKAAIEAGTHTLMVNSAEVNGEPVHASKYLLTDVLRTELGFKGVVISDWEDVKKLHERHKVAESQKEAVYQSVMAGIDLCIVPMDFTFYDYLIELVKEGRISEKRINESVRRILWLKYETGLFDEAYVEKEAVKNFGLFDYKLTALEAARESMTLLKNEDKVLPLKEDAKIFVTGPYAKSITALNGAWSYTWQGQDDSYFSKDEFTIQKAMKKKSTSMLHQEIKVDDPKSLEEAAANAAASDYIIVCLGEDAYAETPGNIDDLELPEEQQKLVKELSKFNKPVIIVLTQGRPRIIRDIEPLCKAILLAYWPSSQGATAIADVLFGDYNPNGKLPFTYPRYSGNITTYDHKLLEEAVETAKPYNFVYEFKPQYEFGFGLSYTKFEYADLKLSSDTLKGNTPVKVSVKVTNTGKRAGKEVVELYTSDLFASITPSVKRLRGFEKISLEPGASKTVEFTLTAQDLAFVGKDLKWVTEPGAFEVMVGKMKKGLYFKR